MNHEMNDKEVKLVVTQQAVIEFAYAVRMLVEPLAKSSDKLSFDEANCLTHLFYLVRKFLKEVDPAYLLRHGDVIVFYERKRELSNDSDCLRWVEAEHRAQPVKIEDGDKPDICMKPYPRGVIDLFWGDGLVKLIEGMVVARGDDISNPEGMKKVLLAWAQAAALEYLRHGPEVPLEDFLSRGRS